MKTDETLSPAYFDDVYAANADPWQFETSAYERAKYAATLAALPRQHFARAFEIGCSIGVLTKLLAPRCDELLSVDISDAALQSARLRLADVPNVLLQKMAVPHEFPSGTFDLVMLSEVAYYWAAQDLELAIEHIVAAVRPGGVLVLVHWTPVVADYPSTGDAVHEQFLSLTGDGGAFRRVDSLREATYRLDVLERTEDSPA